MYAKVTGENSKENVRLYLEELVQECENAKCRRLLIEELLEGPRLDSMSVFDIASEGSQKSRALLRAIAYVDVHAEGSSMKNAESFATNRGLNVRVFRTVAEAENWLMDHVWICAFTTPPNDACIGRCYPNRPISYKSTTVRLLILSLVKIPRLLDAV